MTGAPVTITIGRGEQSRVVTLMEAKRTLLGLLEAVGTEHDKLCDGIGEVDPEDSLYASDLVVLQRAINVFISQTE